jgi:hypothetical protein
MTLYQIEQDILALGDLIDSVGTDEDGNPREITQEEWETLHAYMKELDGAFQSKAERICRYIRDQEAGAEGCSREEKRLYNLRQARERKALTLKNLLQFFMERQGLSKADAGAFKLNIQKNPPSVQIANESEIPRNFFREVPATYTPDKKMISEVLKSGEEVPGAYLVQTESLRVK